MQNQQIIQDQDASRQQFNNKKVKKVLWLQLVNPQAQNQVKSKGRPFERFRCKNYDSDFAKNKCESNRHRSDIIGYEIPKRNRRHIPYPNEPTDLCSYCLTQWRIQFQKNRRESKKILKQQTKQEQILLNQSFKNEQNQRQLAQKEANNQKRKINRHASGYCQIENCKTPDKLFRKDNHPYINEDNFSICNRCYRIANNYKNMSRDDIKEILLKSKEQLIEEERGIPIRIDIPNPERLEEVKHPNEDKSWALEEQQI